ncbi:MAG: hypothetical protein GY851_18280 [bacterium]|nr:hypothetical protein [bacterium]
MFQGDEVYPEYLTDVSVLVCPSDSDGKDRLEGGRWNCGGVPDASVCPCRFDTLSYVYVPWLIESKTYMQAAANESDTAVNEVTVLGYVDGAFLGALSDVIDAQDDADDKGEAAGNVDKDLSFDHTDYGSTTMYRLREGIERFLISDINNPAATAKAQSELPVFYDIFSTEVSNFNHVPGGGNVLYMDGHVSFVRYPGSGYPGSPVWAAFVAFVNNL